MFSICLTNKGHLLLVVFYAKAMASFHIPDPNDRNETVVLLLMQIFVNENLWSSTPFLSSWTRRSLPMVF